MKSIEYMAVLLLIAAVVPAQARQPEIGARPLGMGEAFLALADDGNALLWNPAGLPGLARHEFIVSRADLYGIGIDTNNLGYALPLGTDYALGFDWNNLADDDGELDFGKNSFRLSYGQRLLPSLSLGAGLRYAQLDVGLDGRSQVRGGGWGLDLAVLYRPVEGLRVAWAGRDLTDTQVDYKGGGTGTLARRRMRLGLAYKLWPNTVLAADIDDRQYLGVEHIYGGFLALRAGGRKSWAIPRPSRIR
ncbi:MAG: hypothetical protein GKR89_30560 [Candidatus Latescibacteria bacterium]|nr:hypothetical protein [Candidatus Latescibacterota bacterium]